MPLDELVSSSRTKQAGNSTAPLLKIPFPHVLPFSILQQDRSYGIEVVNTFARSLGVEHQNCLLISQNGLAGSFVLHVSTPDILSQSVAL